MTLPKLNQLQRRILILMGVAALSLVGVMHIFSISQVTVEGVSRGDKVTAEADKLTRGLTQGNLLTFSSSKFESELQQEDPRVKSVRVSRHWTHGLTVIVDLKQPSLGWSTNDQFFVLDRDGTVIGLLPAGSALPVVTDNSNLPVNIGQIVAPQQFVAFVSGIVPQLKANGITVKSMYITDTTLDLNVVTGAGYRLIFDTSRSVASEVHDLKVIMATLAKQHAKPSQYIDLRIQGRAYWQ